MKLGISQKGFERLAAVSRKAQEYDDEPLFQDSYEEDDLPSAKQLIMFIENDGDLYRQQTVPIYKNLARKMKNGTYDHALAPKLWMYLVENGAKKYVRDLGYDLPWHKMIPKEVRQEAAQEMADHWLRQWEGGEFEGSENW